MNFRVNALEQSLRSHTDELVAQKLMVQQLTEAVQGLGVGKETTEGRLNQVFGLVDQRFTEAQNGAQEIRDVANKRFELLTSTMNQFAAEINQRLDTASQDFENLRKLYSQPPPGQPHAPPSGQPYAPPPPPSWGGGPPKSASDPSRPPSEESGPTHQPNAENPGPTGPMPSFGGSTPNAPNNPNVPGFG